MRDDRYRLVAVVSAAVMLVLASWVPAFGVARTVVGECFLSSG